MSNFLFDIREQSPGTFPEYYDSPFGDDSVFNEKGYVIYIDFQRLLAAIKQGSRNKERFWYRYQDYDSDLMIPVSSLMPYPKEMETAAKEAREIFRQLTGVELPVFPQGRRVSKPYETADGTKRRVVALTGMLNVRAGYVKMDTGHVRFILELDVQKKELKFTDLFQYDESGIQEKGRGNYAFAISAGSFEDYDELCSAEGLGLPETTIQYISDRFARALQEATEDQKQLAWLYGVLPYFILKKRDRQQLINDLLFILTGGTVAEFGSVNVEAAVLRILNAFVDDAQPQERYALLQQLTAYTGSSDGAAKGKTGLELLYDAMNDTGGSPNFTATILALYKIWKQTSFSQADTYLYEGQPENLAYQSKKILGFYSDNYTFGFAGTKVLVEDKAEIAKYALGISKHYSVFASYPLLYPIQLPGVTPEGEIGLPDGVPAFYLKAFADKNAWANFEKDAWIAVDVITTATGVGNLLKLRHLATAAKGLQYLRLAIAGVQIASGVVGTMLNFVNNCGEGTFCHKLRSHLFWLDLATLSADAFTERMLRQSAREALDVADSKVPQEIKEHLSDVAELGNTVSGRSRRLGQRLLKKDLQKAEGFLKKMGLELEIFPTEGEYFVKGFFDAAGQPVLLSRRAQAMFLCTVKEGKIALREGCTAYEYFHELMHARHAKSLGRGKYIQLGGRGTTGELVKEQWVFDKIAANRELFTREELKHALGYMNKKLKEFGKDPITFGFDLNWYT